MAAAAGNKECGYEGQIGPFRAGRVTAVAGIPGNSAIYSMGTPGGGVWTRRRWRRPTPSSGNRT